MKLFKLLEKFGCRIPTSQLFTILFCTLVKATLGQLIVDSDVTANQMVSTIAGSGVITQNAQLNCPNNAYGIFDATNSNVGLQEGILLTTGFAETKPACTYSLIVGDSGNDGWGCNELYIYVDGVQIGPYSDTSTWGSTSYQIIVETGVAIAVEYVNSGTTGCDSSEHWYELYDGNYATASAGGNNPSGSNLGQIPSGIVALGNSVCGNMTMYGADGPNDINIANVTWYTVDNVPDLMLLEPTATNDVCLLEFDLIPGCDTLELNYVFASEEYLNYVCSSFNDAFGFFISGPGINGPFSNNGINMATVPGTGDFVGINTINNGGPTAGNPCVTILGDNCPCNASYYVDNGEGDNCPGPGHCNDPSIVRYDGMTVPMTAKVGVIPCETYKLKLVIADAGDWVLDSGVFLSMDGLNCSNPSGTLEINTQDTIIEGCLPGEIEIIKNGSLSDTTNVNFQIIGGSATDMVDFSGLPTSISILPGNSTFSINIDGISDGIAEGTENIELVVSYYLCDTVAIYDTLNFTLLESFDISLTSSPEDCGQCDGSANVSVGSAGTPPFVYNWTNAGSQTTPSVNNLCPGTYIIEVIDALGCMSTDSINVLSVGGPTFDLTISPESCLGAGDGAVIITPVINGNYEFALNGAIQSGSSFTGISPGTWTVSVIDTILNCQTDSIITIPSGICCLSNSIIQQNPNCSSTCDGSIDAQPMNEIGTINSQFTELSTNAVFQGLNITNLCEGTYLMELTDSLCTVVDTIVLAGTPSPIVNLNDTVICSGSTLEIIPQVSNVYNPPLTYQWSTGSTNPTLIVAPSTDTTIALQVSNSSGCASNIDSANVQIADLPGINTMTDSSICFGDSITLTSIQQGGIQPYSFEWEAINYQWNSTFQNPTIAPALTSYYTLQLTDACGSTIEDSILIQVNPSPNPQFTFSDSIGCIPLSVHFALENSTGVSSVLWNFGNGQSSTEITPTAVFNNSECHDIQVTITSEDGCTNDTLIDNLICPIDWPVAQFQYAPHKLTIFSEQVNFLNLSSGAIAYNWFIDSSLFSTEIAPAHTLSDEAQTFEICLVAINELNCTDTTCHIIQVLDEELVFAPNSFTPDGDEYNNTFKPILSFTPDEYHLTIYNRWGQLLLESFSSEVGWDGTYNGQLVQDGTYIWKLEVAGNILKKRTFMGHVTILR